MQAADALAACPAPEELELLAAGAPVDLRMRRHAESCTSCRATLAAIVADNDFIDEVVAAEGERPGARQPSVRNDSGPEAGLPAPCRPSPCPAVPGYDLVREIHRGGQGIVYEALQHSTRRRVALKLLLRGELATPRQLRRFDREIETVAALRHPGIVTLFESGRTLRGETYFAMELVEGSTLDQAWARRRATGGGGLRDALTLFAAICRAVTHAHQKGVIHCDLKPSNILVDDEGAPRLLDFGIARMQGGTEPGEGHRKAFAGTFAYAAPEQLASTDEGFDVRVDVYALGVILHQLLVGELPWAACSSVADLVQAKCAPVAPLSQARLRGVDGEVTDIVLRALATRAADRYQSVAELLDDVERRLADRPISMRKDSVAHVLRKAAQRHRRLVTVLALGLAACLTLAVLLAVMVIRHERERLHALDTLSAFREALAATDPLDTRGGGTSMEAFLGSVGSYVDAHLADQPASAAAIHGSLGQIAISAAEYDLAERHLNDALVLAQRAGDETAQAECLHHLGRVSFYRGDYAEAARSYRTALDRRTALLGAQHPDVATTTSHLASCLRRLGDLDESERLLRVALASRMAHPERPDEIAAAWNNLGSLMQERGRLDDAGSMFEEALETIRATAPPGDWRVAHALRNRAACLIVQGRCAEADADLEESASIWQALVDEHHPALASVRFHQARAALCAGRLAEASALAQAATDARRQRLGATHPEHVESLELVGRIAIADGRDDDAIAALTEALDLRRQAPRLDVRAIAGAAATLGELRALRGDPRRGDHEAATALLRESTSLRTRDAEDSLRSGQPRQPPRHGSPPTDSPAD